jgi:ATP/maltotriose-dependent transcriptional regulator MalT
MYLSSSGNADPARDRLDRVVESARQLGDRQLELRGLVAWIHFSADLEPTEKVMTRIPAALELIRDVDDPLLEYNLRFRCYHLALIRGDLKTADGYADDMATLASRLHSNHYTLLASLVRVELEWARGAFGQMRKASDQALALESDISIWRQHVGTRAWLDFELGDVQAGKKRLGRYLSELERIGINHNPDGAIATGLLGNLARVTGDEKILAMARAAGDSWIEPGQEERSFSGYGSKYNALKGLALVVALQRDRDTAARLLRGLARARGPWIPGFSSTREEAQGLLSTVTGDYDAAVAHLCATLEDRRRGGMKTMAAWACAEYAEALLGRDGDGDRQQAAGVLEEGAELSRSLGMKALHQRIRALMRKAGRGTA